MATESALKSSADYGPMAGFRNMLRKENARWWSLRSLAAHLLVWMLLLNALVAIVLFIVPPVVNNAPVPESSGYVGEPGQPQVTVTTQTSISQQDAANMGMVVFFQIAGFAVFIGATIFGHDAILKERESGTAAWLLSKPLSRKAFVLSKVFATGIGIMVVVLFAQGAITYIMCSVAQGSPMPVLPFLAGLCVLGIGVLFYMALSIALGAFTLSRGVTLGLPLLIGITGGLFMGILQVMGYFEELGYIVPWNLTGYASSLATSASLASDQFWPWPVLATAVWVVLFIAAAVTRFEKLEL